VSSEVRHALIVATAEYTDPKLQQLRAPAADAETLATVLRDPAKGNFVVDVLVDEHYASLTRRIASFFRDRHPNDLLLLHFSCHGVKDERGELYLAAADTEIDLLSATGVSAAWLNDQISRTRSRRTVVLLDCCFSGSFPFGLRSRAGDAVNAPEQFEGRGRVIITASSDMEYAYEGDELKGEGHPSVFTEAVVEGLQTGMADLDHDQLVSVDDLYGYVYDRVKERTPAQTPNKKSDIEGHVYLARSSYRPPVEPATLDPQLLAATEDRYAGIRLGAVNELSRLLASRDPAVALAARQALSQMVNDDSREVSTGAQAALDRVEVSEDETAPEQPDHGGGGNGGEEIPVVGGNGSWYRRRAVAVAAACVGVAVVAILLVVLLGGGNKPPPPPPSAARWGPGVALDKSLRVWVSDPRRQRVVNKGEGHTKRPYEISEGKPRGVASDADGNLFVAVDHGTESRVIREPRVDDPLSPGEAFLAGSLPAGSVEGIAIGPDKGGLPRDALEGGVIWLSDPARNQVLRIDTRNGARDKECVNLGDATPKGLATSPNGRVWIADSDHSQLLWIGRNHGTDKFTVKRVPVGESPTGIAIANSTAWVTHAGENTITRIHYRETPGSEDPPDLAVMSTDRVSVGHDPLAGVAARGDSAWVVSAGDGKVTSISESTPGSGAVANPKVSNSDSVPLVTCPTH
jgi:sugar lactone lactonase YvrE